MKEPTTPDLHAQVRKYLSVRPKAALPAVGTLEISIQLSSHEGLLLMPIRSSLTLTRPLQPDMREIHLSQAQRCLAEAEQVFLRDYAQLFKQSAGVKKPERAAQEAAVEPSVVVAMYPATTNPEVSSMLEQTKARPREEELSEPQEQ